MLTSSFDWSRSILLDYSTVRLTTGIHPVRLCLLPLFGSADSIAHFQQQTLRYVVARVGRLSLVRLIVFVVFVVVVCVVCVVVVNLGRLVGNVVDALHPRATTN